MAEISIKRYVFKKGAAGRIPVNGTFELTPRCNFNCKMCYVHLTAKEQAEICGKQKKMEGADNSGELTKTETVENSGELTAEEWIQLGREAVREGMIYLLLTGGEPLLRPDFQRIYEELVQMGLLVSVNTNGSLITPEIVDCFKKFKPEKVNITLYGMSEQTYDALCGNAGGFSNAMRGIQMLKQAGIRVNLNTTFTKYNLGDMDGIISYAKEEKIPVRMSGYIFPPVRSGHVQDCMNLSPEEMGRASAYFDLQTLTEEQRERRKAYILRCIGETEEKKEFSEQCDESECDNGGKFEAQNRQGKPESKASSCMAGRGAFWVSWDGSMYPCGMLSDYRQDVRMLSFHDAWQKTCESVKEMMLPAECSVCRYQPLCPTCAAVSYSTHQVTDRLVPEMCIRTKAYVETFLNGKSYLNISLNEGNNEI